MGLLRSRVDTHGDEYRANRRAMSELLDEVTSLQQQVLLGGGEKYLERHKQRGKLTARERIDLVLDRDAAFLELSTLAGYGTTDPLGAGTVTGIGVIEGTECVVTANDPTVRGGSSSPSTVQKGLRALEISGRTGCPRASHGVGRRRPAAPVGDLRAGGRGLQEPHPAVEGGHPDDRRSVFGSSTAGGAYIPGMSDYTSW